jgi:hypothetical protein
MNVPLWVAGWFAVSVVAALLIGRVLRRSSQVREALDAKVLHPRQCWGCGGPYPDGGTEPDHREDCPTGWTAG